MMRYLVVWIALLLLTGLSYLAAQLHLGAWEIFVALAIAAVKATLVGLFFMHLIEQRFTVGLVGIVTMLWVALLCLGVAADVGMR